VNGRLTGLNLSSYRYQRKETWQYIATNRTISLVSRASKILLSVIMGRIRGKMDLEIAEEQAGFRAGKGTRDQIVNLRIFTEKARDFNQPLFLCIDYTNAFDTVSHDQLWMTMIDMGSQYISSISSGNCMLNSSLLSERQREVGNIEAFEMWCNRRVLRVSWTDHRTNEARRGKVTRIRKLKLSYYGQRPMMRKANC